MRRFIAIASAAALSVVLFAPGAGSQVDDGPTTVTSPPGGIVAGYVPPVVPVGAGEELVFENLDLFPHNVTARISGPEDEAWCEDNTRPTLDDGDCPILFSATVGTNTTTPVLGTENLEPGQAYPFYCSLHPWMNGVVVTEPV